MNYGLFLPPFDALADPSVLAQLAAEAEACGWDGVFVWDHLLYSAPVRDIADPFVCLAAIACRTERVQLGPMVTPLARRRPAVLARQAVSLDRLSNGRLVLGFGLGDDWGSAEFSSFGDEPDPRVRARMLDEGLEVLAALLSGVEVRHRGEHYSAEGVRFSPGARAGGIPIWIGARYPNRAPVRRAARHSGCFVIQAGEPELLGEVVSWLGEAGAPEGFELVVTGGASEDPEPWRRAGATWWLTQIGPYRIDLDEARSVVAGGPPRAAAAGDDEPAPVASAPPLRPEVERA